MRHAPRVVLACLLTTAAGFAGASFAATASSSAVVLVGDQTVETTVSSVSSGSADAFAFTAASGGTASSISVYLDGQNRASALRVGLYSDAGGNPGTLLAAGSTSSPDAGAWNTLTIAQTTVSAQSTYWIAILGSGGALYFRAGSGASCRTVSSGSRRLRALPSSWRTQSTGGACPISAYASGTTSGDGSGGGGTPPAPTAAFTYSPAAPVTGQQVKFDASASSCPATPCTYGWSDLPPSGGTYPLGTGITLAFTFQVAGTKYVTLTVTDAQGRAASVEHNVTVSPAPTQTQAPLNTATPSISGTAQQGQTLKTSDGSWSNGVTGLSYAWQDCNSSGGACAAVAGVTSATYTLTAADVGHTIRSVVTATNAAGSTSATSGATAVVTALTTSPPPPPPPPANCDLNATPSTFASQVSAATTGQTVCLATGSYGTWTGTSKAITIAAASGASPTMSINLGSGDSGFTLDGMHGIGGTISAGASNITIRNSAFASQLNVQGAVAHIVVDHDDFTHTVMSGPGGTGPNSKIYLNTSGAFPGAAVTVENSTIENGDLDGVHFGGGSGDLILNNRFQNLCDVGNNHTDAIQFQGGNEIDIKGNYVYDNLGCGTQGITSYDGGTDGVIIEDNVVDITRDWGIEIYSDHNSIIRHNTVVYHPYSDFGHHTGDIDVDRKTQDPAGTGTQVYNNVAYVSFSAGSTGTQDHNTDPSTVSYVAGAPGPNSVYSDLFLAAGSPGAGAASDGLDTGIERSLS